MNATLRRALALALGPTFALYSLAGFAADPARARDGSPPLHPNQAKIAAEVASGAAGTGESVRKFEDIRASKLIGMSVRTPRNERLGKVHDVVVDLSNARAHYAVLEFDAPHFVQKKLFVYPIGAFRPSIDGEFLELNVDKGKLDAADGFGADRWPDWSDSRYRRDLDARFGIARGTDARPDGRLVRASDRLGKSVKDSQGKDIGKLVDLVVSLKTGDIRYSVVEFDKRWLAEDKLVAIPLRAYVPSKQGDELQLGMAREDVARAPGFSPREWPVANINSNAWLGEVDRHALSTRGPDANRPPATPR